MCIQLKWSKVGNCKLERTLQWASTQTNRLKRKQQMALGRVPAPSRAFLTEVVEFNMKNNSLFMFILYSLYLLKTFSAKRKQTPTICSSIKRNGSSDDSLKTTTIHWFILNCHENKTVAEKKWRNKNASAWINKQMVACVWIIYH